MRGVEKEASQLASGRAGVRVGGRQPAPRSEGELSKVVGGPPEVLRQMSAAVQAAMKDLIRQNLVTVRRNEHWLEIEISTEILFPSGISQVSPSAVPVLRQPAALVKPLPNPLRIVAHGREWWREREWT